MFDIITRKATHITTPDDLKAKLALGRPLRVKYGIDPTNPHMHLGHTVPLRLLRQFQDAGHIAVIIFGDYTASLGDPSGRDEMRKSTTTLEKARKNGILFRQQLAKIIDTSRGKCEQHLNSGWLQNMNTGKWIDLMKHWTVQQLLNRDDFKNRMAKNNAIHLSELMYPLMQAEDSVAVDADIELGGSEQLFTLMLARDWQVLNKQQPQVCITLPILRGTDGVKRMGKSLENFIGVDEEPFEMFSKIMAIPDDLMPEWYNLLTDMRIDPPAGVVDEIGPMAKKKILALKITEWLHDKNAAEQAHDKWHKQFSLRETPDVIQEVEIDEPQMTAFALVAECKLAPSRNMARRLVEQGAVRFDGERITNPLNIIDVKTGMVIKCGRHFAKVKTNGLRESSKSSS